MGTWGAGNFENDYTLDWLIGFYSEDDSERALVEALDTVINTREDEIDASDAWFALTACEVIAALHGAPVPNLPNELEVWLQENSDLDVKHLLEPAIMAVTRIMGEESELREMWISSDGNEDPEWLEVEFDLIARLKSESGRA